MKATVEIPKVERKVILEMTENEAKILMNFMGGLNFTSIKQFRETMVYPQYSALDFDAISEEVFRALNDKLDE